MRRVAVLIAMGGPQSEVRCVGIAVWIVAVRFSRRLDPDVGLEISGTTRVHRRKRSNSLILLVAPLAHIVAPVDLGCVDEGVDNGAGAGTGRTSWSAPAVAGSINQESERRGETRACQACIEFLGVIHFIDFGVERVEGGGIDRTAPNLFRRGHVWLFGWAVVRGIGDNPIHAGEAGRRSLDDISIEGKGKGGALSPSQPSMMADIEVVIYIGKGMELVERVLNRLHIYTAQRVGRIAHAVV